jgi:hypothetical protein
MYMAQRMQWNRINTDCLLGLEARIQVKQYYFYLKVIKEKFKTVPGIWCIFLAGGRGGGDGYI